MFRAFLMILDLDGYTNLWNKFHDYSGLTYGERKWVSDTWRRVMWEMIRQASLRQAWNLRAAWYRNEWDVMYEMILEWYQVEEVEEIANYA